MGDFEEGEHPEWVLFRGHAFAQNDVFKEGEMTTGEARELVKKNLDEVIGFSWHCDYPEYRWVVRRGTGKLPGQAGWTCAVYKVKLPTADESKLFKDDFACMPQALGDLDPGLGWARPGRGEGLGDQLTDVDMIQGVDPGDLQQGDLGDCWLLSAFAAMCEFPHMVRKMVTPNRLAVDGKYTVSLFDFSQRKVVPVEVDDRIPMAPGGLPRFAHFTKDDEIWPCIFEKAVAKLAGSYANINAADPIFALGMLTGTQSSDLHEYVLNGGSWQSIQPTFTSCNPHNSAANKYNYCPWPDGSSGDQGKHWSYMIKMMANYDSKDYLMCATTHAGSDKDISSFGIVQGHAYTVISVELNVAGSGRDMLELRNPWGTGEWTGDWSDQSDMWQKHPSIKKALDFEFADDGIFWIEAKDFFQNYSSVEVCCKSMRKTRGRNARQTRAAVRAEAAAKAAAPPTPEPEVKKKLPPPPKPPIKQTKQAKDSIAAKKLAVDIPGPETITASDGTASATVTVSRPPGVGLEEWAVMKAKLQAQPADAKLMENFSKDTDAVRKWMTAKAISEHYQPEAKELVRGLENSEFGFIIQEMKAYGVEAVVNKYCHNNSLMTRLSKALGGVPGETFGHLHQIQETPVTLHEACKMGDLKAVKDHITAAEKAGTLDLEVQDAKGVSCLAYAVGANRIAVVKLLLEMKADLKKCDSKGGTSLHYAAAYGRKELADFLIGAGVNVNATTQQGLSPLALATKNRQQDVVDLLKKKGAK
uniref:Calpain catalytic domain-containing protein n=1 Tax=Alexandrium monilatum TaxID=311494 RepID=A0A7S4V2U2_9DINO|mmetsp:Transcript_30965/g.92109  ORF Transcript_30965/g.92109 Transcript_30965/m.92109 type:complete len:756 (-) Transcript_30965:124-2391(-)